MMRTTSLAFLAVAAVLAAPARADIYKCVDAQGHKTYTDNPAGQGQCVLLEKAAATPLVTVPMGNARRNPDGAPRRPQVASAAPAGFPRVDAAQQRARDDDRRGILQDELRAEEQKLTQLRAEFNNGEPERQGNERNYAKYQERVAQMRDNIARSEKNIEALKRELASIR
ncbi:DUF4124 domain-containing protein [Massilia arenosa]|uniref:DUF4124 domain-containing protein n=1 Tax=Zemynaea arenosa TaxID=2561931 RepID=A0A4Y9SK52_9BURK|nr:DUF4124 domain-containing protein [Massilia arenosa]TFW21519.1 DUF4124 domain-containing protein [Massilia arenosa]